MFALEVASLGPGLHTLRLGPTAESLELDPDRFKEVRVDARLDVSEGRILVSLEARAVATLECDRTLRLFEHEIAGTYNVLFAPAEFAAADEACDEVRPLEPFGQEIDLTDIVRDTLLLAVPQRCIAPGADEEELPMEFGAPKGQSDVVDPRWEALRALISADKSN